MKNQNGFTLTELLITIAISSILGMISVPGMNRFMLKNRIISELNMMQHALALTRYSAINTGKTTTICPSVDQVHCIKKWEKGYIIFTDKNGNHLKDPDDVLIQSFEKSPAAINIKWKAFQRKSYLQYRSTGITNHQNGSFTFCPNNTSSRDAKALFITRPGRVRVSIDSDENGIDEDAKGKDIECGV